MYCDEREIPLSSKIYRQINLIPSENWNGMAFAIWIIPFCDIHGAVVAFPSEVLYHGRCQPETPLKIPTSRPQHSGSTQRSVVRCARHLFTPVPQQ